MTKYARDEFDRVPETSSRQGVHRAVSQPPRRRLLPVFAVGIAALAIGLVAFLILPKLGFQPTVSPTSVGVGTPDAGASTSADAASASPEPSAEPSVTPSPSSTTTPTLAGVDKTKPIDVYNGSGVAGLASRVSATVTADGWTLGQVGNWGGAPQQTSVIFYAGETQKANAEALGALLKISTLVDSAEFQVPVVVVLGPGFQ